MVYVGAEIASDIKPDMNACADWCQEMAGSGCTHWSFYTYFIVNCVLRDSPGTETEHELDVISGNRACSKGIIIIHFPQSEVTGGPRD